MLQKLNAQSDLIVVTGQKTITYTHGLDFPANWAQVEVVDASGAAQTPVIALTSLTAASGTAVVFTWGNASASDSITIRIRAEVNHSVQGAIPDVMGTVASSGGAGTPYGGGGGGASIGFLADVKTVSTAQVLLTLGLTARSSLEIFNDSDFVVYVGGPGVTSSTGYPVKPGTQKTYPAGQGAFIYAWCASSAVINISELG
jgi:hypothetical protein